MRWPGPRPARRHRKDSAVRCSVFAGGFDLAKRLRGQSGSDDSTTPPSWICSIVGAQVAAGRRPVIRADPVFDVGNDPAVCRGATRRQWRGHRGAGRPRPLLAGREAEIMALWDGPRQREAYDGSPPSWPTCGRRSAGPPTTAIWTPPPPSASMRHSSALGRTIRAGRVGRRAYRTGRAVDHRRLASAVVMAAQCYTAGRVDDAFGYSEAGQNLLSQS